ncbi:MAG: bifunctional folylpolyglutamate synthase/dihydrofolate synthase [Syntrophomonadales bacterium]
MTRFGIKPGLHRIRALLACLDNPHKRYAAVHIAGTNGKGSVSAILNQVLSAEGYRVGVFTSPHLHSYCERMRINHQLINADELWALIKEIKPAIKECEKAGYGSPTEFEILTALAFTHFERQGVEIAVIETGMGGIYDSTNVVQPLVTAITNVSLDHLQYLGPAIEDVAYNKAGIIKPGAPMVYGDNDPVVQRILMDTCCEQGSPLILAANTARINRVQNNGMDGFVLDLYTPNLAAEGVRFSLPGSFQLENLATAIVILDQLHQHGFPIKKSLAGSLLGLKWPGRVERVHQHPEVILDAAHNLHGAQGLARAMEEIYPNRNRVLVIGILDDKDGPGIFKSLSKHTRLCILTRPEGNRASNWLRRYEQANLIFPLVYVEEGIEQAVNRAVKEVQYQEYILISGSFMTIDRARRMFTQT